MTDNWSEQIQTLVSLFDVERSGDLTPSETESAAASIGDGSNSALLARLAALLDADPSDDRLWLTWATLRGELPLETDVVDLRRSIVLNGALHALRTVGARVDLTPFGYGGKVEIISDAVIVDVHDTCQTDKISGIQRVVRETVSRWGASHEIVLVAWNPRLRALRRLTPVEEARIRTPHDVEPPVDGEPVGETAAREQGEHPLPLSMIVPNGGLFVVSELAAEEARALRLLSLARFSASKTAYIGYDCVPVTSGETASAGIAAHFPLYLDGMAFGDKVAAISASTAVEFEGWKQMIAASGRRGPDVRAVFLGGDSADSTEADLRKTRAALRLGEEFVVLVVGSHEPRKNHLSVLQAARALWRRGEQFHLVFIGSSSWNSEAFESFSRVLQDEGYPLTIVKAASDSLLSASYRLADVSVFTSLHEGFGLPIVESLRAGTPVIASNVGSMAEIAETYGGVIVIDPHSDEALERTLHSVITDPKVLAGKRADLAANDYRTWESYAEAVWQYFVS